MPNGDLRIGAYVPRGGVASTWLRVSDAAVMDRSLHLQLTEPRLVRGELHAAQEVIAAGVFAFSGLQLSPVLASAAMSLSSVSVLISSLWLRRFARSGAMLAIEANEAPRNASRARDPLRDESPHGTAAPNRTRAA